MINWLVRLINKRQKELFDQNKNLEKSLEDSVEAIRLIAGAQSEAYKRIKAHVGVIRNGVQRSDGPSINVTCDAMEEMLVASQKEIDHINNSRIRKGIRGRNR